MSSNKRSTGCPRSQTEFPTSSRESDDFTSPHGQPRLPEQSLFTLNIINVATFLSSLHHKRRFLSARYLHRLHEFRLHFPPLSFRLSTRNAAPTSSLGLGDLEIMFCCFFLLARSLVSGPPRARWWRNNTQGVSKHWRPTQPRHNAPLVSNE